MRSAESIRAEKYGIEGAHVRWLVARYGYVLRVGEIETLAARWPSGSVRRSFRDLAKRNTSSEWDLRKSVNAALAALEKESAYCEDFVTSNQTPMRNARRRRILALGDNRYPEWVEGWTSLAWGNINA